MRYPKVRITGAKAPKIGKKEFAGAIGAKPLGKAPKGGPLPLPRKSS